MARQNGNHVEYAPADSNSLEGPQILRVFGSQLKALLSAVENGNRVIFLEHGETLQEGMARVDRDALGVKPRTRPTVAAAAETGVAP